MLESRKQNSLSRYPVSPLARYPVSPLARYPVQRANRKTGKRANVLTFLILVLLFPLSGFAQEQQFTYDSKGKRNPFIPLLTADGRLIKLDKEEAKGDLQVEGIIFDKRGRSYTIVNGQVVGIGDSIAGYEVLKIENNKVVFINENKITEIEVHQEGE
jgi:hypothetical protein